MYTPYEGLTLWDVTKDARFAAGPLPGEVLPVQNTIGGAFLPEDEHHILLVDERGIIHYNLEMEEVDVLNPSINSTWASWAMFSPDNRWVAVLADGYINYTHLYVMPTELM